MRVLQPFTLVARRSRELPIDDNDWTPIRSELDRVLLDFMTLFPVAKWRTEPQRDEVVEFSYKRRHFGLYARGWLDIPVEGPSTAWFIEL